MRSSRTASGDDGVRQNVATKCYRSQQTAEMTAIHRRMPRAADGGIKKATNEKGLVAEMSARARLGDGLRDKWAARHSAVPPSHMQLAIRPLTPTHSPEYRGDGEAR